MTITERLKLELVIREHLDRHGEDFYIELERILSKISSEEEQVPPRGQARMRVV